MHTAKTLRAAVVLLAFANLANATDLLDRLPPTTRILLRVPDGQRWAKEFSSTAIHGVIYSETFEPLRTHLGIASDGRRALQQVGLRAKDIRQLAQGEVILARIDRISNSNAEAAPSPILGPNEDRATVTAFEVDEAVADQVMRELKVSLTQAGAVEEPLSNDNEFPVRFRWPGQADAWIYNYHDGHFSVCDRRWLSRHFANAQQTVDPDNVLRKDGSFAKVMQFTDNAGGDSADSSIEVQWFAQPWALASASDTTNMLLAQGFGKVSAVGGRLYLSKDGTRHCSFVVADRPLPKAASGLAFVSRELPKIPSWILSQASGCLVTQLDFNAALQGYGQWFDEKHGAGDEGLFDIVLQDIRDEPGSPGVDIRADLVSRFEGPLLSVVVPLGDDMEEVRVFAIHLNDTDVVTKAIQGLLAGDPDVQQFHIGAFPCWKFGDLSRGGTRQVLGPDLSGLTICVARDYVVAAPKADVVERLVARQHHIQSLGSQAQSLASQGPANPFRRVVEELGVDRPIGLGYSNSLGPIGNLYERVAGLTAREQAKSMAIPELLRIFHINASEVKIDELRSKLPRGRELTQLFGRSIDAAQQVEDGWLLKGVVLRKAD